MRVRGTVAAVMAAAIPFLLSAPAWASPYVVPSPIVSPGGPLLPAPATVPGKEFSHFTDRDSSPAPDLEQVIGWDGSGGTGDAFDYSFSRAGSGDTIERETDAISAFDDALFTDLWDGVDPDSLPAFPNATHLLYSVSSIPAPPSTPVGPLPSSAGPIGGTGEVSFELFSGAHGVWAPAPAIDSMFTNVDLDGLEIWGGEPATSPGLADAKKYSHDVDAATGVSVWHFDGTATSTPYIPHGDVVAAVTALLGPLPLGVDQQQIDLDALMSLDKGAEGDWEIGDSIIFSIDHVPVPTGVDPDGYYATGGEIFVMVKTGAGAGAVASGFLFHGGHLWDHAFALGFVDTATGVPLDVNALEAASSPIPEPASACVLGIGLALLVRRRR